MPTDENEARPSWLDEKNDKAHKAEVEPLFGTGTISLQDSEAREQTDLEKQDGKEDSVTPSYGAVEEGRKDEDHGFPNESGTDQPKKSKSRIPTTASGKPEAPRRHPILAAFHFIESVAIIISLALMASQIFPIVFIPAKKLGATNILLKIYISMFCILFIFIESDARIKFLKKAAFLQTYFSRGFLYSFVAVSCMEEAYSERISDMVEHIKDGFHVPWLSLFMQVTAWAMLVLGLLYMILGLCCLKLLRSKMSKDHAAHWAAYKEAMRLYRAQNPEDEE